jgi:hypothetical protein
MIFRRPGGLRKKRCAAKNGNPQFAGVAVTKGLRLGAGGQHTCRTRIHCGGAMLGEDAVGPERPGKGKTT